MKKLLFFAIFLSSCISAHTTLLNNYTYDPISPSDVVIYITEDDVKEEYEKLAILNLKGDHSYADERKLYSKARKEAAKIGANGIISAKAVDPTTGSKVANFFLGTAANRTMEVILIRTFSEEDN